MKQFLKRFYLVLAGFMILGCDLTDDIKKELIDTDSEDSAAIEEAIESLDYNDITFNLQNSYDSLTEDIVLPDSGSNETSITWSSDNDQILSSGGVVNRPLFIRGDIIVTLTATVSKGDKQSQKTFEFTIIKLEPFNGNYTGNGTEADPYLVNNAEELQYIHTVMINVYREYVEMEMAPVTYFKQTRDIDLLGIEFNPIGNTNGLTEEEKEFEFYAKVNYDGDNFKIKNLDITDDENEYVGLFAKASNSVFSNIILEDVVKVTGTADMASAGSLLGGTDDFLGNVNFLNVHVYPKNEDSIVSAPNGDSGGIAGYINGYKHEFKWTFEGCSSGIDVLGGDDAGGLAGYLESASDDDYIGVFKSFSTGNIKASGSWAGGLIGSASYYISIVSSYSTGDVEAEEYAGGLIGLSERISLVSCYTSGDISTTKDITVGGLVGYIGIGKEAEILNSYAIGNISHPASYTAQGGLIGNDNMDRQMIDFVDCYYKSGKDGNNIKIDDLDVILRKVNNTDYYDDESDLYYCDDGVSFSIGDGFGIIYIEDAWGLYSFDNDNSTLPTL